MIKFDKVALSYGPDCEILRNISLHIEPYSFQFLTGPSGSGKTSLLRLMFLALRPSSGHITLFGQDIAHINNQQKAALRRHMGMIFQHFYLLNHLTIFDNVALPLYLRGQKAEGFRQEIIELLQWIGLGHLLNAYPPQLSAGEKQRTAIARTLIFRPAILLADEPTGNLDPILARRLLRLFVELNRSGTTIVIATHDVALMDQVASRRFVLRNKELLLYE